jgi:hypothetical protein
VLATTGSEALELRSLKATDGAIGGVDIESSVYRALLADGTSVIARTHLRRGAWVEEAENLRLLNALAPEHGVELLASADHTILTEDAGEVTLASAARDEPEHAMEHWLAWAQALATVHARSLREGANLRRPSHRVQLPLTRPALMRALRYATRVLLHSALPPDRALMRSLDDLGNRLRAMLADGLVFGFQDPNPANVMLVDGGVRFIDVGGAPFGLAARAFSEHHRAPEPHEVAQEYVKAMRSRGVRRGVRNLQEELGLYEVASSIEWLERHLKADALGGIPDIDGSKRGTITNMLGNLETIERVSGERRWLTPLAALAQRLHEAAEG